MSKILFSIFGLVIYASTASALPLPRGIEVVPESFTQDYDFEGIVKLNNCSGSLVRFETSSDKDAALVITNGHCLELGMPKPGKVITKRQSDRTFRLMNSQGEVKATLNATEIIYSSMTKTDITIYKLEETYADIINKYSIRPFTLAKEHPTKNTSIDIVSGYWDRGYRCAIEEFAYQLKEAGWTFEDSIRYSRPGCETIGGTSGSPIIQTGTRNIIGINNTGNEDGDKCTMNNPCEIDANGNVVFEKGWSYGQQTYWIYSCLDNNNNIDLTIAGCQLAH
ncbi:MAG: hypothetical protein A4S09_10775 [Proteobacteria bacterium SG_bin7]|nr:MAG: hypothetical protein A4S09_10775 [Proteobacteria bacterium SG_bin7]